METKMLTLAAAPAAPAAPAATFLYVPLVGTTIHGGLFAGIIRGTHAQADALLILLPGDADGVCRSEALTFAAVACGDLPTRREQSLLLANLPEEFQPDWYWSCEAVMGDGRYWLQDFDSGYQAHGNAGFIGRARVVRRVPI
jgi:hypothetical protein